MKSIRYLYKIGKGPSSSHSMGPQRAAELFRRRLSQTPRTIEVELYGSLAATGKGHLTDRAILETLSPLPVKILWLPEKTLPLHPNGMIFRGLNPSGEILDTWEVYSIGGGDLLDKEGPVAISTSYPEYEFNTAAEILRECEQKGISIPEMIRSRESADFYDFLEWIWKVMSDAVDAGLRSEEPFLPGGLRLARKAPMMYRAANENIDFVRNLNLVSSYALAVAEENASGGTIVTAPTCGSAGVLPGVLYYFHRHHRMPIKSILDGLIVAGVFGSIVASNASISGAMVGCQGEIGTACAMASAAAACLLGGTPMQIEYAAEMGLEHCLGLTCDPVAGLVQIPCIERNAFMAVRAVECAMYSLATRGEHLVSFDEVVEVMNQTGRDLQTKYRETATGGLAQIIARRKFPGITTTG
ncbi:MAG: L-serine ammonia-lyase [Phycisphaerae bacterium]|nr:L-serine ammonia-lyase [Phycisphaerae bacterium]